MNEMITMATLMMTMMMTMTMSTVGVKTLVDASKPGGIATTRALGRPS